MDSHAQTRYRARVVPRGSRGSRASRVRWDRVGRVVLVLALAVVMISYVGPTLKVFDTWREAKAADTQLTALKAENNRLQRQAGALEHESAAIAEARKLGMVAPDEKAYVIDDLR